MLMRTDTSVRAFLEDEHQGDSATWVADLADYITPHQIDEVVCLGWPSWYQVDGGDIESLFRSQACF